MPGPISCSGGYKLPKAKALSPILVAGIHRLEDNIPTSPNKRCKLIHNKLNKVTNLYSFNGMKYGVWMDELIQWSQAKTSPIMKEIYKLSLIMAHTKLEHIFTY